MSLSTLIFLEQLMTAPHPRCSRGYESTDFHHFCLPGFCGFMVALSGRSSTCLLLKRTLKLSTQLLTACIWSAQLHTRLFPHRSG